nr:MAG TPA: hypothetical protein [Bacteriophage sp.]
MVIIDIVINGFLFIHNPTTPLYSYNLVVTIYNYIIYFL